MQAATEKNFTIPKDSQTKNKALHKLADELMREDDRVIRWKKAHRLLRLTNKKARKEQDITAEDAKYFRANKLIKKEKSSVMGLRWGVALPPMTFDALVQADTIVTGSSDLKHHSKEQYEKITGSNQIVKDLEKAFPQYRVIK